MKWFCGFLLCFFGGALAGVLKCDDDHIPLQSPVLLHGEPDGPMDFQASYSRWKQSNDTTIYGLPVSNRKIIGAIYNPTFITPTLPDTPSLNIITHLPEKDGYIIGVAHARFVYPDDKFFDDYAPTFLVCVKPREHAYRD